MATVVRDDERGLSEQERFLPPHGANGNSSGLAIHVAPRTDLPPGIAILRRCIRPLRDAPITFYQFYILGIFIFNAKCYFLVMHI